MIVYPAIDLKEGHVVRLIQGEANRKTVYSHDPADPARKWRDAGSKWVHVVDLDGAFTGKQANADAVRKILDSGLQVQLGGGIRTTETIQFWLDLGVRRVVIGTRAATDPDFVSEAIRNFSPENVAVGIDAKDGQAAIKGWVETVELSAIDFAKDMQERGVRYVIYTDISRDGMMSGPNFEAQQEMLEKTELQLIASGGVSKTEDLAQFQQLAQKFPNLHGVITGKALYDGRIDLAAWLRDH